MKGLGFGVQPKGKVILQIAKCKFQIAKWVRKQKGRVRVPQFDFCNFQFSILNLFS